MADGPSNPEPSAGRDSASYLLGVDFSIWLHSRVLPVGGALREGVAAGSRADFVPRGMVPRGILARVRPDGGGARRIRPRVATAARCRDCLSRPLSPIHLRTGTRPTGDNLDVDRRHCDGGARGPRLLETLHDPRLARCVAGCLRRIADSGPLVARGALLVLSCESTWREPTVGNPLRIPLPSSARPSPPHGQRHLRALEPRRKDIDGPRPAVHGTPPRLPARSTGTPCDRAHVGCVR